MKDIIITALITISSIICAYFTLISDTINPSTNNIIIRITIQPLVIYSLLEFCCFLFYRFKIRKTRYIFSEMNEYEKNELTNALKQYLNKKEAD